MLDAQIFLCLILHATLLLECLEMLHLAFILTAVAVSVTCFFKIRHWIIIVSNTHSVRVITEQNSLRHKLSHWAAFTFLKRTALCIKFCLNPCADHKPCEQTPALFSRALQPQAKLGSTTVTHLPISHTACCFPGMSFPLPWPYLVFTGSQNDAPGEGTLIRLPATARCAFSPTSVLNWSLLQQAGAGWSPCEF